MFSSNPLISSFLSKTSSSKTPEGYGSMMLVVNPPGPINKSQTFLGKTTLHGKLPCAAIDHCLPGVRLNNVVHVHNSLPSWKDSSKLSTYLVSHRVASKRWLCQSHSSVSSDDEYRSSRNIAISLFRRYRNVIDRGGADNLKEFISAGVNAYALGCTDEGLRKELIAMKESGIKIEVMHGYGASTSVKSKICAEEINECILWASIIFITILCTPQPTIVRWSSTPPVSNDVLHQWKGFCALIANAYYIRGMAWLPVKTLQLEQMAVVGRAEEPSVVASRMRLVFSTLEVVSPQWPRV